MQPQRLDLRYTIQWISHWHVGSGYRAAGTDRIIQRLGGRHGTPFLPGAQVKGVVRHACERLAQTLGLTALDPHATTRAQQEQLVQHFVPLRQTDLVIDRLFGSRYQGDCLFIENAYPSPDLDAPSFPSLPPTIRARTTIDRVTGTVKERHLYTTELAEPALYLHGMIRARHPAGLLTQYDNGFPYEYALLVAGLLSVDALGGDKSTGLGRCIFEIREIQWNAQVVDLKTCLASFEEPEWDVMLQLIREGE